jgi:histidinol-phosphate phosphatase family protein
MAARTPAVFLDRDGTVIRDASYPRDPGEVSLLPGAVEALSTIAASGFRIVVVSNQSGIGRGLVSPEEADAVHDRFAAVLQEAGVRIDGAYYCPHSPDDGCDCRKPAPGLLLRAAEELDIDLASSIMVGDKDSDLEAGRRAGCSAVRFRGDWAEVVTGIVGREAGAA